MTLVITCCVAAACSPAAGSELRDMLRYTGGVIDPIFEGSVSDGNSMSLRVRYTNESTLTFAIYGLEDAVSHAPEDVGLVEIAEGIGLAEIEAMYPSYDLFNTYYFGGDPPRQNWLTTEIEFQDAFPIVVPPGQSFTYTRKLTNARHGPAFGPTSQITQDEVNVIGESLTAIDLDWGYVPEPSALTLAVASLMSLTGLRRRA